MIVTLVVGLLFATNPLAILQGDGPPIAAETSAALVADTSNDYLIDPFLPQTGTQVPVSEIPAALVNRTDTGLGYCLAASLAPPPIGQRNYLGFRKAPTFLEEYMWLTWTADGRRIRMSDRDPQTFLLIELKAGELQATDDDQHKSDVVSWVESHLQYPATYGPFMADIIKMSSLPSGKLLWIGTVTSSSLEDLSPNLPSSITWATGVTYWTDGSVICLKYNFPTLRPQEAGSPTGAPPWRDRSRFDQPSITGTVTLQDWAASTADQVVEVDVKDSATGTLLVANRTMLDINGHFSVGIPNLAPGAYKVTAKGTHWLSQTNASVAVNAAGASGVSFSLLNGDVNGDNVVSLADFGVFRQAYLSHKGDATYNPSADLNGDGTVDASDYAIYQKNYGQSGG